MKRTFSLLLAALMLAGVLAGCGTPAEPADTTDPAETTPAETTPAETTADTEPPVEEEPAYKKGFTVEYEGFSVEISAPTVVFQGEEGDQGWGKHQFPNIRRTTNGMLVASWAYGEDKVGGKTTGFSKISVNGGTSWVPNTGGNAVEQTLLMPNGKYFAGFRSAGTPQTSYLSTSDVAPAYSTPSKSTTTYFAEDIADLPTTVEKNITGLSFNEYDPEAKTWTAVECTLNWPYAPVTVYPGNYVYSVSGVFGLSGSNVIVADNGNLYTCIYCGGFDSFAESKEAAVTEYAKSGNSYVFVFESTDCARTWDLVAQLTPGAETDGVRDQSGFEGYDEPRMIQMPDGSFLMLMRTGSNSPMYVTRSEDGHTWTTPEQFDYCGVLPFLLQFDCGITVASYGRPDLLIRLTDDPTGAEWEEHIEIPLSTESANYSTRSCFYTNMLQLDEDTAILIYSDFLYPNKKGVGVRTILTRTITVTPNE